MYENNRKILSEIPEMKDIRSVSFTCASSARRFFDQIGEEKQRMDREYSVYQYWRKDNEAASRNRSTHILESKGYNLCINVFIKSKNQCYNRKKKGRVRLLWDLNFRF